MSRNHWPTVCMVRIFQCLLLLLFPVSGILAGGGLVLQDDVCILKIDFYSAHFTAYQPATRGNEQFCQDLPDVAETIFVLDYLHPSLKHVPVDFRIIRNVTGQGRFVKLKHVEEIGEIEQHTVFYQAPVIRPDDSFRVEYEFKEKGEYVGIISAGHPSNDTIYTAVFPFKVGGSGGGMWLFLPLTLLGLAAFLILRSKRRHRAAMGREVES